MTNMYQADRVLEVACGPGKHSLMLAQTFLKNKDHPVPQPAAFQHQVKKNQTQVRPNMPHRRSRSNFEVKASGKSATQELSPYVLSERSLANLKTSTVSISITTT